LDDRIFGVRGGSCILKAGFKIKEEMGYYDKRPINQGPELIFVCGKG
jgi:hypothetical protein